MHNTNKSNPVIEVRDLIKKFDIYDSKLDIFKEVLFRRSWHKKFTALDGVSFALHPGEVVGILGRNGAGKSTLLRIIAGTLPKTSGELRIKGRIGAILELGAGFNPDYSGHENIFMGGLCLGLSRKEIESKYDWIVAFSGLGKFIEWPVRTYSTGMHARLAFSVAVCIDPDILIVDEALSVGDAKFQRKCFSKFEDMRESGKTILFVTHDTGLVNLICDRAIYLHEGKLCADGVPSDISGLYLKDLFGGEELKTDRTDARPVVGLLESEPYGYSSNSTQTNEALNQDNAKQASETDGLRYGNRKAEITDYGIRNRAGDEVTQVLSGDPYIIYVKIKCNVSIIDEINPGISIRTKEGVNVFAVNPILVRKKMPKLSARDILVVEVRVQMLLGIGDYFMTFGVWSRFEDSHFDRRIDVIHFSVRGDPVLSQSLVNMLPDYQVYLEKPGKGAI